MNNRKLTLFVRRNADSYGWDTEVVHRSNHGSYYIEATRDNRRYRIRVSNHRRKKGRWDFQVLCEEDALDLVTELWSTEE